MTRRRHILAAPALAATMAAAPAPTPAAAQTAPGAGRQAPGFFRSKLGGWTLLQVNDGMSRRPDPRQGFIRNAAPAAVESALRDAFMPLDRFDIFFTVPFLETPRGLVAFDTGTGGHLGEGTGRLRDNLRAAGFAPSAVVAVVFTHFHPDHVSGLTDAEGKAVFPNAALHVPAPEWNFWNDEGAMSRAPEAQRPAFRNVRERFAPYAERLNRFEPGAEVMPGIKSIATHGHTPGHTSYVVENDGERVLILGDVTNRPELFVRNPGWHAVFDMDPAMAEATRRRVLDMAAGERLRIAAYHWPFPALGHVAKDGEGYRWAPSPWSPEV